jgi:predicted DNA-binding transcriptional regulator AlpA
MSSKRPSTARPLDASAVMSSGREEPRNDNVCTDAPSGAVLIDEKQLCAELGISGVTATKWRAKAEGPPFIKVGRLVRYRRSDVEAWLLSRTVGRRVA